MKRIRVLLSLVLSFFVAIQPVMAQQLPSGMTASEGVTVDATDPNILVINAPDHATIDWDSFSIGADQSVRFILPNETSSILNRVLGGSATDIWGALYSNGIVFLVNTSGINFHANAQIDTASLIASTLDISKENFQSGNYEFQKVLGSEIGKILNEANISATNIVFLAEQIQNKGVLEANLGRVFLGSGSKQTISFDNNGSINLVVDEGTANSLIENSGTLRANGGKVMLTAKDINVTLDTLVNNTGIIEATRMVERDGVVEFVSNGAIENSGTIDVSKFNEKAYTFRTSGTLTGGTAHFDNLDGAAEIAGDIGSNIYDTGDLIVTSDITLINSITLGADLDGDGDCSDGGAACDGTGVFYMQEGTSIIGQGYNLTIYSSQNPDLAAAGPTLRTISNVGNLTLYSSYDDTDFEGRNNISSNSLSIRSGSSILNGDSYSNATSTSLQLLSGDITTGAVGVYASAQDLSGGSAALTIFSGASLSGTSLILSASEGRNTADGGGTLGGRDASLAINSGATVSFTGDAVLNGGAGLDAAASDGTGGGGALIQNAGTLLIQGSLSAQGGNGGNSADGYSGGSGGAAGFSVSAATTINGNLTLNSGSSGSDFYNYGVWYGGAGGSAVTTGNITLNGSGVQHLSTGVNASIGANLTYSGLGTLMLADDLDMNGNLSVTSGTFDVNSQTQNYGGNYTVSSGAAISNNSNTTVTFDGSGTQSLNSNGNSFFNLTHSGSGSLAIAHDLAIAGAFTNSAGTYEANGFQTTVGGHTTVSGGTYIAGSGNQNLNGGLSIIAGSGNSGSDGLSSDNGGWSGSDGSAGASATYTAGTGITTTTDLTIQSGSGGNGGNGGTAGPGGAGGVGGTGGVGGNATLNAGDEKVRVTGSLTLGASIEGNRGSGGAPYDYYSGGESGVGGIQGVNTYTGTLLMNGSGTQNITSNGEALGNLKYSGLGTLRLADDLDLNGDLSVTSGTFNANSRTQNYSGNVSFNPGITLSNAGTVVFDKASGSQTFDSGGKSFTTLQHSGAGTLQLTGNNLNLTGAFTNSAGTYDANGLQTTVSGLTTVSGGTYTARSGNQNLNGGLTIIAGNGTDGTNGTDAVCDIGCSNGSDGSAGVNGVSAAYVAGSGITSVMGNLTMTGGNGGNGGSAGNNANDLVNDYPGGIGGNGGNGGLATLEADDEKVQVSGNITLFGGSGGNQGANSGGWGGSAGGVTNTGTLVLNGTGTQDVTSGGQVFSGITHSGTGTLRLLDSMNVGSSFTNSAGAFNLNGFGWSMTGATFSNDGTVQLIGSETITGLTNNDTDSGTWNYTGSGSRTLKDFGANDYFNLVISGSGTFTAASNLDLNNSFTQSAGTFVAPAGMNVAGDFSHTGGTFTAGTGTVTLDGVNQTISGNTTFYNLTKVDAANDAASRTLSLASGSTQTVTNALTLDGFDEDDRLVLNGAGTFNLTNAATFTGNYLSIQDGTITDNSSNLTLPLDPVNSIDLGGTTGWFTPPAQTSNKEATPTETANRENEIQRSLAPFVTSSGTDTNSFSGSDFSNTQFSNDQPDSQDTETSENENTNEESGGFSESINPNAPIILSNNLFEMKQGNLQEANGMQVNGDEAELV